MKIKPDDELELIPIRLSSAAIIFESIDNSRKHLRPWLPFVDQTKNEIDTKNFILSVLNSTSSKKDFIFEIWHAEQFVGLIALKELDKNNAKVEIGYWLDKTMTGKGIMLKSCKALIAHSFRTLNLNRIMIKVAEDNIKSIAIPEKLGFVFEGIERDGEYINNRFTNLRVYSLLNNEF